MTIFTRIIKGEIPAYKVAETDRFIAFLDVQPIAKGHTLVVPKQEVDNLFDLTDTDLGDMMVFAKSIAKRIERAFKPRKVGVAVIGLEVPHAHIHLVPLFSEGDLDFSKPRLELTPGDYLQILKALEG